MPRGDQGADATATEEYAGTRSDINKDDKQGQERPRSEEEPQAEAKSQDSENQVRTNEKAEPKSRR